MCRTIPLIKSSKSGLTEQPKQRKLQTETAMETPGNQIFTVPPTLFD